jgi:hypothetical protein
LLVVTIVTAAETEDEDTAGTTTAPIDASLRVTVIS